MIIPNGGTYLKLNPNDDVYIDASEYCYYGCYYSKVVRPIKKEEILDLFESRYKSNISNKLPEYLNKTFESGYSSNVPIHFSDTKLRNLDNSDEIYYETISLYGDYFINYVGVFINKNQLILIIQEEKTQYYSESLFQMKYVINNYDKTSILYIVFYFF